MHPEICGGKIRIGGTRITIDLILENLAFGISRDDILKEYPQLTIEDINAALAYQIHISRNT